MKIGFLVNDVKTEKAGFTTTRLGCEALNMGHEVCVFGVGDVAYDADENVRARAKVLPKKVLRVPRSLLQGPPGPQGHQ